VFVGATGVPVCATGVFVGATGVPVFATGVFVGATGVPVCATGVFVGATGVPVFATGVFVGATGVPVCGMDVAFGDTTPAPCAVGAPGADSPERIGIAGGAVVGLTAAGASIRGGATAAGGTIAGCETVVAAVILGAAGATIGNDGAGGSGAVMGGRAVFTTISRPAGRVASVCAPTGSAEKLPTIANKVSAIIPRPSCRTAGIVVLLRACCGNAGLTRLATPLFDARSCVRSRLKRETSLDIPFLHSCDTTPLIAASRRPIPRITMTPTRSIFRLLCGSYPPHLFLTNVVRKEVQTAV